jgi:hypothetical protein
VFVDSSVHGLSRTKHAATMSNRRLKRLQKRITVYDDDSSTGGSCRDVTVRQSATGRLLHSATPRASESADADPWTQGFFDKNSEAFVVDSLPDELPDFDMPDLLLDSNEDIKDRPKVLTVA